MEAVIARLARTPWREWADAQAPDPSPMYPNTASLTPHSPQKQRRSEHWVCKGSWFFGEYKWGEIRKEEAELCGKASGRLYSVVDLSVSLIIKHFSG